jgi:hypothetical protein
MYDRLDIPRERARGELDRVQREETTGTDQSYTELSGQAPCQCHPPGGL